MIFTREGAMLCLLAGCVTAGAQQTQVQLQIEPQNRTLTVSA